MAAEVALMPSSPAQADVFVSTIKLNLVSLQLCAFLESSYRTELEGQQRG